MRTMGLDVGSKTVGVAVSDPFGWTAQGIEIVKINEAQEEYGIDRIGELIAIHEVTKVVIGLPKNMNNSIGPRAEASCGMLNWSKKHLDYQSSYKMNG